MAVTINGSAGVTTNSGAVYDSLQTATAVTASGTSVDFTGIPSWVKRITVMFSGVSTNGTSFTMIQLGDSGGVENTGYVGCTQRGTNFTAFSAGWSIDTGANAAATAQGSVVISLLNASTNTWTCFGVVGLTGSVFTAQTSGSKSLSATLDRIRITTVNGTDTFDAGTINIIYE